MEIIEEENANINKKLQLRHSKTTKYIYQFSKHKLKNQSMDSEENMIRKDVKTKSTIKKDQQPLIDHLTKKDVYNFLSKNPNKRTFQEIKIYAKYLSNNFQYFSKLKNEDSQLKVEKLTKVCKLQETMKGDSIVYYGEIGDKFYIVLEGVVEIYKPIYVEKADSPIDFIKSLNKIKKMDGNDLKFNRIKNKNRNFFDNLSLKGSNSSLNIMKYRQVFIMEEDEKLGEFGEGFSFGDIALIKRTVRNATIKAKENCILLTIEKDDYNKALLEFQRKKLVKEIDIFLKTYSFFKYFSHDKIINVFNCLNTKVIFKGEYLYKQNNNDDSIYFINYGTFSIDCIISFSWVNDYLKYINYSGKNIIQYILRIKNRKINDLLKIVRKCKSKIENYSPKNDNKNKLWEKINEKNMEDNLYKIKKDEDKLNDPNYIFNINLKKINYNEILGLEEVFEFKKRFCSCKCLSEKAEIRSIKLNDFLKLIINFGEDELNYFLNMIEEKKKVLKNQIIKGIKNIEKKLLLNFDMRYDNIIKTSNYDEYENDEEKAKIIISTIKMKGYKDSIEDILDNDVPLLKKEENKTQYNNFRKIKKHKSMEQIISDYGIKKKSLNEFKYKKMKNIFEKESKTNEKNNEENSNISSLYNIMNISQTRNKKISSNNANNKYNNKIYSNSWINKTFNNNDSLKSELKTKKVNSSGIKNKESLLNNFDSKYSNDKTNISSYKSKIKSESPKTKIIKSIQNKNNFKISRSSSVPSFDYKNKNKKFFIKEPIIQQENFNLPKIKNKNYFINTNLDEFGNKNKLLVKGNNNYNKFYNVYHEDKNFYLGIEFQKKLKKEFKFNKNPLKKGIYQL